MSKMYPSVKETSVSDEQGRFSTWMYLIVGTIMLTVFVVEVIDQWGW